MAAVRARSLWPCTARSRLPPGTPTARQQRPRPARVLGGDHVGVPQGFDRPGREVAEVADRRADEHERAGRHVSHRVRRRRAPRHRPARVPTASTAPGGASITKSRAPDDARHAARPQRGHAQHAAVGVAPDDVDRSAHPERCGPGGTGGSTSAPSMVSRPSSPLRRAARSAATSADASTSPSRTSQATSRTPVTLRR